ncbi:hypothetical protein FUT63_09420 [Extensimonas vulgaris]|nr:hypothetical protein FUT63_09420 [Extensimonas vulgaris]
MQILAIPPGIAAVCALPRPKIHRFYLSHQASNTTQAPKPLGGASRQYRCCNAAMDGCMFGQCGRLDGMRHCTCAPPLIYRKPRFPCS